jgi:hypothetical protein
MGRVDVKKALALKINSGLSYEQIAKLQNVTHNAIFKKIKPLLPDESNEIYKKNRADILSQAQVKILSQVDTKRLKRAGLRDISVAFGILYDKERLERGLSTANVDMVSVQADLDKIQADRDKLRAKMAKLVGPVTGKIRDGDCSDGV